MRLCFIGDTGTGSRSQEIAALQLRNENCSSVYVLGDVIYPSGLVDENDPQAEEKFFKYYRPMHEQDSNVLFHIVLGNHDYRGDPDAWTKIAKTNPMIYAPARYYFEEFEGLCIASLDTNLPKLLADYPKHMGQKSWLRDFDDRLSDICTLKIALAHHPYLGSDKKHGNAKGTIKEFLEDFVIGKYDYYLAGHDHLLDYKGSVKGTELYISGAGGNVEEKPGYVVMEIEKLKQDYRVKTFIKIAHPDRVEIIKTDEKLFRKSR